MSNYNKETNTALSAMTGTRAANSTNGRHQETGSNDSEDSDASFKRHMEEAESLEEVTKAPQGEEAVYAYVEKMKAAGYKSRAYMRMTRQSAGTEQYDAARSKWEERTAKEVAATKKAQETLGKFGSEYPHLKAKFTEIFSTRDDQNSREIGQMLNMASQSGTANDQSGQPPSHQGTGGDISEGGAGKVV